MHYKTDSHSHSEEEFVQFFLHFSVTFQTLLNAFQSDVAFSFLKGRKHPKKNCITEPEMSCCPARDAKFREKKHQFCAD